MYFVLLLNGFTPDKIFSCLHLTWKKKSDSTKVTYSDISCSYLNKPLKIQSVTSLALVTCWTVMRKNS